MNVYFRHKPIAQTETHKHTLKERKKKQITNRSSYVVYLNIFIFGIFKAKTLLQLVCENEKMTPNEPVVAVVGVVVTVLTALTVGAVSYTHLTLPTIYSV